MLRMLINATQPEELRVAIADGQTLIDLDIEVPALEQKKSNVYKGRITRVEPSLEACFVDFGSARHGFLPLKEICQSAYQPSARDKAGKIPIKEAVVEGQEIIVQVEKEERGNKGAALTTFISLAGRYLVLMPTNPKAGGVSRRISGDERDDLREQLQQVTSPDNVGVIVRTAGVGREANELQWDLDYLLQLWQAIEKASTENKAPFLIYQESNLFIRALRDHLRNEIGEILVDDEKVYQDARKFIEDVMPHNVRKLKLYTDDVPLFSRYQIESQIESAFSRTVHLPSGGSLVIDHTEALLSIDINSARATKGSDIEDTAYRTNLEAAEEIARQLRLRDLGGLIVIDFIDMMDRKHQRDVEEQLKTSLQIDKARVQTGRISRFGLLEMSRQRLRPSLGESSQETCPRCDGHGTIRSVESLALSILRLLEEEAMKESTAQVIVQAPTQVANFLLNEKRKHLNGIEVRHGVPIMIISNEHLQVPKFEIERLRSADVTDEPSYAHVHEPEETAPLTDTEKAARPAAAAVSAITPSRPAPQRSEPAAEPAAPVDLPRRGKLSQFFSRLFGGPVAAATPGAEANAEPAPQRKAEQRQTVPQRSSQPQRAQSSGNQSRSGGSRSRDRNGDRNPDRNSDRRRNQPSRSAEGRADQAGRPERQAGSDERKSDKKKRGRKAKPAGGAGVHAGAAINANADPRTDVTADSIVESHSADRETQGVQGETAQPSQVQGGESRSGEHRNGEARNAEGRTGGKGRRRRSRYKTGGGKSRDEAGNEISTGHAGESASDREHHNDSHGQIPQSDHGHHARGDGGESRPAQQASIERAHVPAGDTRTPGSPAPAVAIPPAVSAPTPVTAPTAAAPQAVFSAPPSQPSREPIVERPASSPVEQRPQEPRHQEPRHQEPRAEDRPALALVQTSAPAVAVQRDNKGIYTLKPVDAPSSPPQPDRPAAVNPPAFTPASPAPASAPAHSPPAASPPVGSEP